VLVEKVGSIAAPDQVLAEVKDFSMLDEQVRRGRAEQDAVRAEQDAVRAEQEAVRAGQDAVRAGQDAARQRAGSEAAGEAEEFRAVAPPVMSFASGRRR
jgi:uncharacterized protein (DUF3084 family)